MNIKKFNDINYNIIKCDQTQIDNVEMKLISKLYKKFGNVYYSTFITKWNDGTFMIEIRHSNATKNDQLEIHSWTWYNNKITYENYLTKIPDTLK